MFEVILNQFWSANHFGGSTNQKQQQQRQFFFETAKKQTTNRKAKKQANVNSPAWRLLPLHKVFWVKLHSIYDNGLFKGISLFTSPIIVKSVACKITVNPLEATCRKKNVTAFRCMAVLVQVKFWKPVMVVLCDFHGSTRSIRTALRKSNFEKYVWNFFSR